MLTNTLLNIVCKSATLLYVMNCRCVFTAYKGFAGFVGGFV